MTPNHIIDWALFFWLKMINSKEIKNLAAKCASTNTVNYLSDMRTAVFGGQGRVSDVINYLKIQNSASDNSYHDNWCKYQGSKSLDGKNALTEGRAVFFDTQTLD